MFVMKPVEVLGTLMCASMPTKENSYCAREDKHLPVHSTDKHTLIFSSKRVYSVNSDDVC